MSSKVISADLLAKMFLAGAKYLENNKDYINGIKIFFHNNPFLIDIIL